VPGSATRSVLDVIVVALLTCLFHLTKKFELMSMASLSIGIETHPRVGAAWFCAAVLCAVLNGWAVQLELMKPAPEAPGFQAPRLKAPGFEGPLLLNLIYDEPLSNFAFNFSLRRYTTVSLPRSTTGSLRTRRRAKTRAARTSAVRAVGPDTYCSPRHRMEFTSLHFI